MSPLRGIALKVGSVLVFVTLSSLVKATADHVPPGEAMFFRAFFAMPVIVGWLMWRGTFREGLRMVSPVGHMWRGVLGATAMGLSFAGLGLLPLPEVTAIGYAAPILVVVFAALILGERVRLFRISMVVLGMVGVLIVLSPRLTGVGDDSARLGALVVLASAVCAAGAQVTVRRMVQTESVTAIVFWFSVTCWVLALFTLPWGWVVPTRGEAAMLVSAGLLGGVGQILLTNAYRHADASLIAPFDYSSMLLALIIGYVVFAEVPTLPMLAGAALVIAAGVGIIWREHKLGLDRARQRTALTPGGR